MPRGDDRRPGRARAFALAVILQACATIASAAVENYAVRPGDGTRVVFESKAPLESFEGRTGRVSGWCRFDPDDLAAGVELEIGVDMASFDTGIGMRNDHMRENHLETDRFPRAIFQGGRLAPVEDGALGALPPGGAAHVVLHGALDLHGVVREMSCGVDLVRDASGVVRVEAEFPILLSDHDIPRPKFLIMKLADEQKVRVELVLEKTP